MNGQSRPPEKDFPGEDLNSLRQAAPFVGAGSSGPENLRSQPSIKPSCGQLPKKQLIGQRRSGGFRGFWLMLRAELI
jgi:hypothetical protein